MVWGGALAKRYLRAQIWFSGSGDLHTVWCALAEDAASSSTSAITCDHELCVELRRLERRRKYEKYVALIRSVLMAHVHDMHTSRDDDRGPTRLNLLRRLWRQLVVSGCVFASKLVASGHPGRGLAMVQDMDDLSNTEDVLLRPCRTHLAPFVHDAYAYYYFRRQKYEAGLQYCRRSLRAHESREEWASAAKCRLHEAVLLARLRRHVDALKCLGRVIDDVDAGKLETDASAQAERLCMIAVCYHNIAALEIRLQHFQHACVASQNARRLARLCLAFSNRWLTQFDATHRSALIAMVSAKEMRRAFASSDQARYFDSLATSLYA